MLRFWQNPEFVRHRRAELRRNRALAVLLVVLVVCVLIGLICWASRESQMEAMRRWAVEYNRPERLAEAEGAYLKEIWRSLYRSLMLAQAGILTFWSLLACAQSVSGERDRKTWDFQRTTRLTPAELLIGKLIGEPVLAYFIVLCCFPVALVAAIGAGISPGNFLSAYALIILGALFIGLVGLWLSSLLESRSRGVGLIGSLAMFALFALSFNIAESNFPGFAAFSPLSGLLPALGMLPPAPERFAAIFGHRVPWLLASLMVYLTFGAWLVVMLLRNLKRDYEGMRLLSRWQALGCAAFLNFMLYVFFYPMPTNVWMQDMIVPTIHVTARMFALSVIAFNTMVLFAIGLTTLAPYERLKLWGRGRAAGKESLFSEEGLSWPWLALSAVIAYGLLVWGLLARRGTLGFDRSVIAASALQLFTVLLFVTGDVLFIQWCRLTRMRAPLLKGVLYLGLYYAGAIVVTALTAAVRSEAGARAVSHLLLPASAFDDSIAGFYAPWNTVLGWALQCGFIAVMIAAITRRVQGSAAALAAGD